MDINNFVSKLERVKGSGEKFTARCPAHDDRKNSLSVREIDGKILIKCFAYCSTEAILRAMNLTFKDLFNENPDEKTKQKKVTATYDYCDEDGNLLYQNVRFEPKGFCHRRFENGEWKYSLNGTRRVPYRLQELIHALEENPSCQILLTEGEKDCDKLRELGFVASSFKNWKKEFNQFIKFANIIVLADHDRSGHKQADEAARFFLDDLKPIKLIDLFFDEHLPDKNGKDVSDWLELGHSAEELQEIIKASKMHYPDKKLKSNEVEPTNETSFRLTKISDLLAEPEEEVSFIWDKTLPAGGFSITSAKPKVGKSTVARNLAVKVSKGEEFLGRSTAKGKVIYFALEEKRSEVARHFRVMNADGDILFYSGATPENALEKLAGTIAEHEPTLVIIDPLSRILRVSDFNDYGKMARALEPFIDLARKTGCHILALHHDSKMDRSGGDAILGSTALFGAVDCHVQLRRKDKTRIISTTQRYGEDLPETIIELDEDTGLIEQKGDLQTALLIDMKEKILSEIAADEEITEAEIKERVGTKGITSKAIRELCDEQRLFRYGEGKRGNPYFYRKKPKLNKSEESGYLDTTIATISRNLENLEMSAPLFEANNEKPNQCVDCGAQVDKGITRCEICAIEF